MMLASHNQVEFFPKWKRERERERKREREREMGTAEVYGGAVMSKLGEK